VAWSIEAEDRRLRAEDRLAEMPDTEAVDEAVFELLLAVCDTRQEAEDAMYERLRRRGLRKAQHAT
jgi:hypothetical protein